RSHAPARVTAYASRRLQRAAPTLRPNPNGARRAPFVDSSTAACWAACGRFAQVVLY
ncbi:hypothetical protein BMAFMH_A0358, partial [Burkholderia mallei FMH]